MPISPSISPRSTSPVHTSSSSPFSYSTSSLHSLDLLDHEEKTLFRDPFSPNSQYIADGSYRSSSSSRRQWDLGARGNASAVSSRSGIKSSRGPRRRWLMPCSLALNAVLLALVLVMLASPCTISGRKCVYHRTDVATTTGAGSVVLAAEKIKDGDPSGLKLLSEVKGVVPEFKLEKVTFMNDSRYANERMFTDRVEHQKILDQWEADVPVGRGFVSIPDSSISHLPRPFHIKSKPSLNGYSIASYHQYHCLWMIMAGYGRAVFPETSSSTLRGHEMMHNEAEQTRHVTHCFDYLRQSVLCAGDSALEGKSEMVQGMTDGWGNEHVCRSVSAQKKWIEDNRLSDMIGIH